MIRSVRFSLSLFRFERRTRRTQAELPGNRELILIPIDIGNQAQRHEGAGRTSQKRDVLRAISLEQYAIHVVQHIQSVKQIVLRAQWEIRKRKVPPGLFGHADEALCLERFGVFQHAAAYEIDA